MQNLQGISGLENLILMQLVYIVTLEISILNYNNFKRVDTCIATCLPDLKKPQVAPFMISVLAASILEANKDVLKPIATIMES